MSDGLQFLTLGGSEEVIVGNDYCATIGMTNYTYVGSLTEVLVGVENDMKLGGTFACEYGSKMEWTNVGGISIEDGEALELNDEITKKAATLDYAVGYGPVSEAALVGLSGLKKTIKGLIVAMNALNLALGVGVSATMIAQSKGENNGEQNLLDEETETSWLTISDSAYEAGAGVVANVAIYATLNILVKKLALAYKGLTNVSRLKMSEQGPKLLGLFAATGSSLILSEEGAALNSGTAGVGMVADTGEILAPALSSLNLLADGSSTLNGDVSATVKSEAIVKVGQVEADDLTSGLSATAAEVVLKNTETSAVTLTAASAEVRSPSVHVTVDGTQGVLVEPVAVTLAVGTTEVIATDASFSVSQGGGLLEMAEGVVTLDGELLMFG